jgi:heme-degrading monooxygenase HmoA
MNAMHALVTHVNVKPGATGQAVEYWRKVGVPAVSACKGFIGGNVMVDRDTGNLLIVGQWMSRSDAKDWENSPELKRVQKGMDTFSTWLTRSHYTVKDVYISSVE